FLIRNGCCRVSAWSFPPSIPANCLREITARCARSSLRARRKPRKRVSKCRKPKFPKLKFPKNETLLELYPAGNRLLSDGARTISAFRGLPENLAASRGGRNCRLLAGFQYRGCHCRKRRGGNFGQSAGFHQHRCRHFGWSADSGCNRACSAYCVASGIRAAGASRHRRERHIRISLQLRSKPDHKLG